MIQKQGGSSKDDIVLQKIHYLPSKSPTFYSQNSERDGTELIYIEGLGGTLIYQGGYSVKLLPDYNPLKVSKIDRQIEFSPKLFFKGIKPSVLSSRVIKKSQCSNFVFIKNDFNQVTMLKIGDMESDDYFYSNKAKLKIGVSNIVDFLPIGDDTIATLTNDCTLRIHSIDYLANRCHLCCKSVLLSKSSNKKSSGKENKFLTEYQRMNLDTKNLDQNRQGELSKSNFMETLGALNFEEFSILGCLEKNEEADLLCTDPSQNYCLISTIKYPSLTQNSLILVKLKKTNGLISSIDILSRKKFDKNQTRFKSICMPHIHKNRPIIYAVEYSKPYALHSFLYNSDKRELLVFKDKIDGYHESIVDGFEIFDGDMWSIDWNGKLNKLSILKGNGDN